MALSVILFVSVFCCLSFVAGAFFGLGLRLVKKDTETDFNITINHDGEVEICQTKTD